MPAVKSLSSRRSHAKSRGGCDQCKQRRIKCDETKPVCNGCIKRELQCRYDARERPRNRSPSIQLSDQPSRSAEASIQASELETIHFYTLHTYQTCDHGVMRAAWWQETLPRLAFKHDHLLFALLSFTNLHQAHSRPEEAVLYIAAAKDYRDRALKILASLLSEIPPAQAEACFWSSGLIGLISLAMYSASSNPPERPTPKALLLELADLWRGSENVSQACTVSTSAWNHADPSQTSSIPPPQMKDIELSTALQRAQDIVRADVSLAMHSRLRYMEAVDELAAACALFESQGSFSGLLSWFPCLDPQIHEDLGSAHPTAALVVICYGAALHSLKRIWYIGDLGLQLIQHLAPAIPLNDVATIRLVNWARERVCSKLFDSYANSVDEEAQRSGF